MGGILIESGGDYCPPGPPLLEVDFSSIRKGIFMLILDETPVVDQVIKIAILRIKWERAVR
jgi:hypothetical protein